MLHVSNFASPQIFVEKHVETPTYQAKQVQASLYCAMTRDTVQGSFSLFLTLLRGSANDSTVGEGNRITARDRDALVC